MASVRPFRALRPKPELAADIAAVPYDVVSTDEARALAGDQALSFLHVSRAEIDLPPETNPYADAVYERATASFQALKASMIEEAAPAMYFYRLQMGEHEQTGLAACYSVDEYNRDIVKKHEKTRKEKEDDRTRHITDLRAQTGPVFLTYEHRDAIDALAVRICSGRPLYDFTASDGVQHTLWAIDAASIGTIIGEFEKLPAVYIADGHHRAASAARAHDRFGAGDNDAEHAWFLAVAFPDDQTQILPYNRLVKDLNGHTPEGVARSRAREVPRARRAVRPRRRKGRVRDAARRAAGTPSHSPLETPPPIPSSRSTCRSSRTTCSRPCSAWPTRGPTSASTSSAASAGPANSSKPWRADGRPSPSRCSRSP